MFLIKNTSASGFLGTSGNSCFEDKRTWNREKSATMARGQHYEYRFPVAMKWHYVFLACVFLSCDLAAIENSIAGNKPAFIFEKGFEDEEGCLMCHKYPKMARITEAGARRSYYVMPEVFGDTVHRNVECGDCHSYIKQLPHREVKEGVKCDSECHSIKNPATGKYFTHKPIADVYKKSVHGRAKTVSGHDQDKPYCVTCHRNPVYNPAELVVPHKVLERCVICHEDRKFVTSWYKHTSRRIKEVKRSKGEIVALCSTCHGDQRLVERHLKAAEEEGRELGRKYPYAVESYKNSFHGKVTRYGLTKAANCLDCHADAENYFLSVHNIRPSRDPKAPTHIDNKVNTCKRCHTRADKYYAALDPHPSKSKENNLFMYYANQIYHWVSYVAITGLVSLAVFETIGRRRDGVGWQIHKGSSWWRRSRHGRERRDDR
jgi:hypothetical protein